MRVISGIYKNQLLKMRGKDIRPTTARVRENVFNYILSYFDNEGMYIEDVKFLDLCSGTGAMGIEALSRGFKETWFVDESRASIKVLKENLERIVKLKNYFIIQEDARKFHINRDIIFDIVYIDPPYNEFYLIHKILENLLDYIHENSLVILEVSKGCFFNNAHYFTRDSRCYSDCEIIFLTKTL